MVMCSLYSVLLFYILSLIHSPSNDFIDNITESLVVYWFNSIILLVLTCQFMQRLVSSQSLHVFMFVSFLQEWTSKADFTHHAHTASISAVAASERYVVTGSKDETIQLYDMKKKIEHGALLQHDGECLLFKRSVF